MGAAQYTVRRASAMDAGDVFALVEEYYDAASVMTRDDRAKLLKYVTSADCGVWLAYSGTDAVGCVLYHPLPNMDAAGEIKRLYVRPPFRREGLAQRLLDGVERFASSRGDEWLYLDTIKRAPAAIAFYARNEYVPCPRYNDNPQATIFMRKGLMSANKREYVASGTPIVIKTENSPAAVTPDSYANEPIRFAPLHVVDLVSEAAAVSEPYRNQVISRVNRSCLRLAVFNDVFRWHHHPRSDELFLVVEGTLAIDLDDGTELRLGPWQAVTIPAGMIHRTRAIGRTVNLCFEELAADTVFLDLSGRLSD
jgi:mannose-6-phosphate isomerase-like protein (cupin superfamily)/GNAT superfamily N-acetyltransferase